MPNRTTGYGEGIGSVQDSGTPSAGNRTADSIKAQIPANTRPISLRPGMAVVGTNHHGSSADLPPIPTAGQAGGYDGEQAVNPSTPATWTSGQAAAFNGNGYLVDGSGGGGGGGATVASFTLAQADIEALLTTPFELVAAPGANKIVVVDFIVAYTVFGTTPYTVDGTLDIVWNPGTTFAMPACTATFEGILAQPQSTTLFAAGEGAQTVANIPATAIVNQAVAIRNEGTTMITDGDGDLVVVIGYNIITLP